MRMLLLLVWFSFSLQCQKPWFSIRFIKLNCTSACLLTCEYAFLLCKFTAITFYRQFSSMFRTESLHLKLKIFLLIYRYPIHFAELLWNLISILQLKWPEPIITDMVESSMFVLNFWTLTSVVCINHCHLCHLCY